MKPLAARMSLIASISRCSLDPLGSTRASESLISLRTRLTYETPVPLVASGALCPPLSYYTLGSLRACVPLGALEASLSRCSLGSPGACVPLGALRVPLSPVAPWGPTEPVCPRKPWKPLSPDVP